MESGALIGAKEGAILGVLKDACDCGEANGGTLKEMEVLVCRAWARA